jgi:hypothetical protein
LHLPRTSFIRFITTIKNAIKNNPIIFEIKDKRLFAKSFDDSGLKVLGVHNCKSSGDFKFALFDLKKIALALNGLDKENISFDINDNFMEYSDSNTKFKIYFLDESTISDKVNINPEVIEKLKFQKEFLLEPEDSQSLKRVMMFSPDATIITFTGLEDSVTFMTKGKTKLSDEMTHIKESSVGVFEGFDIKLDVFKLVTSQKFSTEVKLNTDIGFALFKVEDEYYNIQYITSKVIRDED